MTYEKEDKWKTRISTQKFLSGIQQRSFVDMGNCNGIDNSIFRENSLAGFRRLFEDDLATLFPILRSTRNGISFYEQSMLILKNGGLRSDTF
jgi:hypothetical protein